MFAVSSGHIKTIHPRHQMEHILERMEKFLLFSVIVMARKHPCTWAEDYVGSSRILKGLAVC